MIKRLFIEIEKRRFRSAIKKIRNTSKILTNNKSKLIVVSLIYHDALDMTLLAIKSFLSKMISARVELIDDGSLTKEDYAIIQEHLSDVNITHINDIDVGACPKGSCWERLVHIIKLSNEGYVVQVDTDTLTIGNLSEVVECIESNKAFTIGSPQWQAGVSLDYLKVIAESWKVSHTQVECERNLILIDEFSNIKYLRGCAAFTGFPKGQFDIEMLERLSNGMQTQIGEKRWNEWGTEQFASNVMVSCLKDSMVLPWPKYQNFEQPLFAAGRHNYRLFMGVASVIHFIGSTRYNKGTYRKLGLTAIDNLK